MGGDLLDHFVSRSGKVRILHEEITTRNAFIDESGVEWRAIAEETSDTSKTVTPALSRGLAPAQGRGDK
jgi:hypothetical protein